MRQYRTWSRPQSTHTGHLQSLQKTISSAINQSCNHTSAKCTNKLAGGFQMTLFSLRPCWMLGAGYPRTQNHKKTFQNRFEGVPNSRGISLEPKVAYLICVPPSAALCQYEATRKRDRGAPFLAERLTDHVSRRSRSWLAQMVSVLLRLFPRHAHGLHTRLLCILAGHDALDHGAPPMSSVSLLVHPGGLHCGYCELNCDERCGDTSLFFVSLRSISL